MQQIPNHSHPATVSTGPGTGNAPAGNVTAQSASVKVYISDAPAGSMNAQAITPVGGSQPHENCQPFLCINFIISLFGVFPSQT